MSFCNWVLQIYHRWYVPDCKKPFHLANVVGLVGWSGPNFRFDSTQLVFWLTATVRHHDFCPGRIFFGLRSDFCQTHTYKPHNIWFLKTKTWISCCFYKCYFIHILQPAKVISWYAHFQFCQLGVEIGDQSKWLPIGLDSWWCGGYGSRSGWSNARRREGHLASHPGQRPRQRLVWNGARPASGPGDQSGVGGKSTHISRLHKNLTCGGQGRPQEAVCLEQGPTSSVVA